MKYGYKLFEMDSKGNLYPLFIGKNKPIPLGIWVHAEFLPTKGFSPRGGWHLGADVPDAPWLKGYNGTNKGCYRSRWKTGKRVWGLCEYNDTNDYNTHVSTLPGKAFVDRVPDDGYYFFKEVGKGTWIISSDIRIVRILNDDERENIMASKGYDEISAYAKYKTAMEKRLRKE